MKERYECSLCLKKFDSENAFIIHSCIDETDDLVKIPTKLS